VLLRGLMLRCSLMVVRGLLLRRGPVLLRGLLPPLGWSTIAVVVALPCPLSVDSPGSCVGL
jgi:hypothetical protein